MTFTVYSKDGCPYCVKIQQVLKLANLEHVIYKMGQNFSANEFLAEFGSNATFPQIILNDEQVLGGCSDTIQYLQENKII
jgi:glutaredoxin